MFNLDKITKNTPKLQQQKRAKNGQFSQNAHLNGHACFKRATSLHWLLVSIQTNKQTTKQQVLLASIPTATVTATEQWS